MAIQTKDFMEWVGENAARLNSAIKGNFIEVAKNDIVDVVNNNSKALQDGVYIGKQSHETWGSAMVCEPWQTTKIGIEKADADAIVIQYGGYRLGIALTEPTSMLWGSVGDDSSIGYQKTSDLNTFDGKVRTTAIMKSSFYKNDDPATYAVAYAANYSKSHEGDAGGDSTIGAGSWFLPSMGDLALIHRYFETINLALTRIKNARKQDATLLVRTNYWSCCESSGQSAFFLYFSGGLRASNPKVKLKCRVRPVTAF